jgi:hypothetical protein
MAPQSLPPSLPINSGQLAEGTNVKHAESVPPSLARCYNARPWKAGLRARIAPTHTCACASAHPSPPFSATRAVSPRRRHRAAPRPPGPGMQIIRRHVFMPCMPDRCHLSLWVGDCVVVMIQEIGGVENLDAMDR